MLSKITQQIVYIVILILLGLITLLGYVIFMQCEGIDNTMIYFLTKIISLGLTLGGLLAGVITIITIITTWKESK